MLIRTKTSSVLLKISCEWGGENNIYFKDISLNKKKNQVGID